MKLGTCSWADRTTAVVGAVRDGHVIPLAFPSVVEAARAHLDGGVELAGDEIPLDQVQFGPPVGRPGKIICVGLNYRDHAAEAKLAIPERPLLFAKLPSSVIGPNGVIALSPLTEQLDYEAELALVIGREARDVSVAEAPDCIAGYMNFNDVTARDLQFDEGGQWMRGKSLDTFAPTGPYLVTPDEIPEPQELPIRCELNGTVVQSSSTSEMVFSVAKLVSYISTGISLMPGDIIATGTPSGVGMAGNPPRWLQEGDRITVEVGGLGRLENPIVSGLEQHRGTATARRGSHEVKQEEE